MERDPFTEMQIAQYRRLRELYGDDVEIVVVCGSIMAKDSVHILPADLPSLDDEDRS